MRPFGHIVVLGTAGSGKTTVAALRAQYLSDPSTDHSGRTLLVTYNRSLVKYLKSIASDELINVRCETFHQFARGYLASKGQMRTIVKPETRARLVTEAMDRGGLMVGAAVRGISWRALRDLLIHEFQVIARTGLTREAYTAPTELHRSQSLSELMSPALVYDTLEQYRALRDSEQMRYDWDDILVAAHEAMIADSTPRLYKHIIIDEGQDFAPVMLRTLIAAIPPDGSITFFGDAAQQIYGRESNWREAGFAVQGPVIFEENLRNTPEIAALGMAIQRMPYYSGVPDLIPPTTPMDAGPPPTLVRYRSSAAEINGIIVQAQNAVRTQNVAIICPTNELVQDVISELKRVKERRYVVIDRDLPKWYAFPRIYVSTYYNAKGLEFGAVLLPFLSSDHMPNSWLTTVYGEAQAAEMAGSWLYVGVSRCRRSLVMSYHDTPSPLLPLRSNDLAHIYHTVDG